METGMRRVIRRLWYMYQSQGDRATLDIASLTADSENIVCCCDVNWTPQPPQWKETSARARLWIVNTSSRGHVASDTCGSDL